MNFKRPTYNLFHFSSIISIHLLMGLIWLPSCAHPQNTVSPKVTTLPQIHVVASPTPQGKPILAYDAHGLFEAAGDAMSTKDFVKAAELYQRLRDEFPQSNLLLPTLYNWGICLDEQGRHEEAVIAYRELLEKFPGSSDVKNTLFRLAASLEELEKWDEMVSSLETLEAHRDLLDPVDQVEIRAKKGAALLAADKPGLARIELEHAIRIFTRDNRVSPTAPDYYYAMAQFKLAELTHAEMRNVSLPVNDQALARALEHKCQLLLDAQYLYTQVIQTGHPHWSAAAAYSTGALYHHLWKDMLDAPAPNGLSAEEEGVYNEVLRKRIKILLQKAVKQWRRTMTFALRLNLDNAWVAQTQKDLREIETVLEIEQHVGADLPVK
ncbi:MAG: tetratricopeptide repeat protein [Deltaproteobacteria bacterium]|nr:tetratricopeptide repeat protein [Deltaproteobacteria bacterium]